MTLLGLAKGKKHTKKTYSPQTDFYCFLFFSLLIYISFFIIILKRKNQQYPYIIVSNFMLIVVQFFFVKLKRCHSSLTGTLPSASADKACARALGQERGDP